MKNDKAVYQLLCVEKLSFDSDKMLLFVVQTCCFEPAALVIHILFLVVHNKLYLHILCIVI